MAKVKNALFSFGASGTVAKILTINQSISSQVARRKPSTSAPPTAPQIAMRQRCEQAALTWHTLTLAEKNEWKAVARLSAKNVFAKYLIEWNAQGSTPTSPPFIPMR